MTMMQVDTSIISIFPYDSSYYWIFKQGRPADLMPGDLDTIEILLVDCIDQFNSVQEKRFQKMKAEFPDLNLPRQNFIIELKKYKRQYMPVINNRGEKEVWINCLCETRNTDWQKNLIMVKDGGNCFFNLKINLTTGRYYDFRVNGEA